MGRRRAFAHDRDEPVRQQLQRVEQSTGREESNPARAEVLRLQRSGGNEAVAGVLARDRTKTPPPRKQGPEEQAPGKPKTLKIEDVGTATLLSLDVAPSKGSNELRVTIAGDSPILVELQRRSATGAGLGTVVIEMDNVTWTLEDVYIGELSVSSGESPTVHLSLNYKSLAIDYGQPDKPGTPDTPRGWDLGTNAHY